MKVKKLGMVASIIIFIMFVILTYAIDSQNIVGTWLFDEGQGNVVKDSSGNGLDGKIVGSPDWVDGKSGSALDFAGKDGNYVSIPHKDILNLEEFSITAWVKLQPREVGREGHWHILMLKEGDDGTGNYLLFVEPTEGMPHVGFKTTDAIDAVTGATSVVDGNWRHIAGTYDKVSLKLYVDGVLDSVADFNDIPVSNDGALFIGNSPQGDRAVNGIVDEVGLFNTALTENDVKETMTMGAITPVQPAGKLASTWSRIKSQY